MATKDSKKKQAADLIKLMQFRNDPKAIGRSLGPDEIPHMGLSEAQVLALPLEIGGGDMLMELIMGMITDADDGKIKSAADVDIKKAIENPTSREHMAFMERLESDPQFAAQIKEFGNPEMAAAGVGGAIALRAAMVAIMDKIAKKHPITASDIIKISRQVGVDEADIDDLIDFGNLAVERDALGAKLKDVKFQKSGPEGKAVRKMQKLLINRDIKENGGKLKELATNMGHKFDGPSDVAGELSGPMKINDAPVKNALVKSEGILPAVAGDVVDIPVDQPLDFEQPAFDKQTRKGAGPVDNSLFEALAKKKERAAKAVETMARTEDFGKIQNKAIDEGADASSAVNKAVKTAKNDAAIVAQRKAFRKKSGLSGRLLDILGRDAPDFGTLSTETKKLAKEASKEALEKLGKSKINFGKLGRRVGIPLTIAAGVNEVFFTDKDARPELTQEQLDEQIAKKFFEESQQ